MTHQHLKLEIETPLKFGATQSLSATILRIGTGKPVAPATGHYKSSENFIMSERCIFTLRINFISTLSMYAYTIY